MTILGLCAATPASAGTADIATDGIPSSGIALSEPSTTVAATTGAADIPASPAAPFTEPIDRNSRTEVRAAYLNQLKPLFAVPVGWTGNASTCTAGTTSSAAHQATLDAVNFYRRFVGMVPVVFDPAYDAKAQAAALIMRANGMLSHNPPVEWKCWTQQGADGAGASNLAMGSGGYGAGARAIDLYMDDPGSSNTAAGHRRWILNSYAQTMGSGSTDQTNALYVITPPLPEPTGPQQWGWPTEGYFPREMEPAGRWSFSSNSIDFSDASVEVTGPDGAMQVTQHPLKSGYGDDTLVWNVQGLPASTKDLTYTVNIDGLTRNDEPLAVTYDVVLFTADPPPPPPPPKPTPPKPQPPAPKPTPPRPNRLPIGGIVLSLTDGRGYGMLAWAIDPDTYAPTRMRVVIPGVVNQTYNWNYRWKDMPRRTGIRRTEALVFLRQLPPGKHRVCFDALDANGGGWVRLGCRTHVVK